MIKLVALLLYHLFRLLPFGTVIGAGMIPTSSCAPSDMRKTKTHCIQYKYLMTHADPGLLLVESFL